jgi:hypothetical protein
MTLGVLVYLLSIGRDYYTLSSLDKPFSDKYQLLKPSGMYGHGFGIVGTLLILIGVILYMSRKRVKAFFSLGPLKYWLEFHIFLCTLGPLLVLFHTDFKFGGIVAISFWSMVAVVLSGVIGRFIYIQIPRSIQGNELSSIELEELNTELTNQISQDTQLPPAILAKISDMIEAGYAGRVSETGLITFIFHDLFSVRKKIQTILTELKALGVEPATLSKKFIPLLKSKISLQRKIHVLKTMQQFLHHWHIFHLPFAIIMFIIMLVHVFVAVSFGYRWIF